jgi:chromosomal replication initiation ATPase DnaA
VDLKEEKQEDKKNKKWENIENFSILELIEKIKKTPKKAFLAIWLQSSKYEIKENIFYIISPNSFTKDKINVSENIVLIQEKLKEMWFDYEVKVK